MSLATALYDALTGINIPKDQAREVVEALDQKMTNEVATKSDIGNRPVSTVLLTEIRRRPDLRARATLLAEQAERRAATQDSRAGDPRVG